MIINDSKLKKKAQFFLFGISFVVYFSILCLSCYLKPAQKGITIAGSTSIQPFADQWAEVFMSRFPEKVVNVQGGGSSAGVQAAITGASQIGMSSRELKPEEKVLTEFIVAWDGLVIIVHPSNPVDNLSLEEVRKIFAGEIISWKEVGGFAKTIHVVTREEGSGTRVAFQEMVMGQRRITKKAIVQDSNGTVREVVANDPYAIGYISLGLVEGRVKAIRLDGLEPSVENIVEKKYRLVRPFILVTNSVPHGIVQDFIQFILSEEGQNLIQKQGLIPARLVKKGQSKEE
ncbi:MAG: phosphate ABC transporter substrate-binding protein [Candidatus Aminicenantes bacterium]|nr:phosphate ABC transporter substrate-binding protein [Candidatus Aminicenantes bacterium]